MNHKTKRLSRQSASEGFIRKLLPTIFLIVLSVVGVLYGQQTVDSVLASSFQPTSRISATAERLSLTDEGKRLLYASQASVEEKQAFNDSCQSAERTAAILGCYYHRKIYLFNITNPELDGALEVTAAHEMLHAAYERLNFFERAKVDAMVRSEYTAIKSDPAIAEVMAYYEKAEPGAEVNELHSIIGTTVSSVNPELEKYYAQYFKDRSAIVALNTKYNAVFTELNKRAEILQAELKAKEPVIKQELDEYNTDRQQLETDIQAFNERASSQGFSNQSSFTLTRNALIRRANELNARRAAINQEVTGYNSMISELNRLSVKANEYNQSLNGVEAPAGV